MRQPIPTLRRWVAQFILAEQERIRADLEAARYPEREKQPIPMDEWLAALPLTEPSNEEVSDEC